MGASLPRGDLGCEVPIGRRRGRRRRLASQHLAGPLPLEDTVEDGWLSTAPVRAFSPNGYGLYQPIGNVCEWCADRYDPRTYRPEPTTDPRGPDEGGARVMRGGSYLCHISYCNRYRNYGGDEPSVLRHRSP